MRLPLSLLLSLLSLHTRIDSAPVNLPGHQLDKFSEFPPLNYDFTFEVPLPSDPSDFDIDTEAFRASRIRLLESMIHDDDSEQELEHSNQRYPEIQSERSPSVNKEDQLNENNKRLGAQGSSTSAEKRRRPQRR
ncbi:hypothetical protein K7432_013594 [Basidiobolus ranarum]|uniref:Uncharacterized protein n=1 Tax=Basidiobolus ranarum TaxID=34480 RepID=A0ABR2WJ03_9FUNG